MGTVESTIGVRGVSQVSPGRMGVAGARGPSHSRWGREPASHSRWFRGVLHMVTGTGGVTEGAQGGDFEASLEVSWALLILHGSVYCLFHLCLL